MSIVHDKIDKITEYWEGKYILPNGQISDHRTIDAIPVIGADSERECWACGAETDALERCHIVPSALGGPGYAENLFILCSKCHADSPDTTNREAFFRWVYARRKEYYGGAHSLFAILYAIDKELGERGMNRLDELYAALSDGQQAEFSALMASDKLAKYSDAHMVAPFGASGPNFNSIIITIVDYIIECYSSIQ